MSMISAQIDELRIMAKLVREYDYAEISRMLREAADTIWQLRDDLQQANAENDKLRELARDLWQSCPVYTADCYGCEYHSDGGCKLYNRMCELGIEVDR